MQWPPLDGVSAVISVLYVLRVSLCCVTNTHVVWGSRKCGHCFTTYPSDGQRGRVTEMDVQVVRSVAGLPVGGEWAHCLSSGRLILLLYRERLSLWRSIHSCRDDSSSSWA